MTSSISTPMRSATLVGETRIDPNSDSSNSEKSKSPLAMTVLRAILGWMTPYEQMTVLRKNGDEKCWEVFRDSLMRKWSSMNVICGLIMSAVSTIVFAEFPLSTASFTLGIFSLLSSLIAIGFGVGLIYVLCDVQGSSIQTIDNNHPKLLLIALSIPEIWALVSFAAFFTGICVVVWEADNKGWIVKGGVALATTALVIHLAAFGFLFREQDTTHSNSHDDHDTPKDDSRRLQLLKQSRQQSASSDRGLEEGRKGKATSLDSTTSSSRPGMPSRFLMSSETLVEDPDVSQPNQATTQMSVTRVPPIRASTAPVSSVVSPRANTSIQLRLQESVPRPARQLAPPASCDDPGKT